MIRLSLATAWAYKRRLLRTCSAVVLGVAFLVGTLVLNDTMRAGFDQMFTQAYSGVDVVVQSEKRVGSDAVQQLQLVPEDLATTIAALPQTAAVRGEIDSIAQIVLPDGSAIGGNGAPTLGTTWYDDYTVGGTELVSGTAPQTAGEIAIDRKSATEGPIAVGDMITVRTPAPNTFEVTGILTFDGRDSMGGAGLVAFTPEDARAHLLHGFPGFTSLTVQAGPSVTDTELRDAINMVLPTGLEAITGQEAADAALESLAESFLNMLTVLLLVFSGIALFVAAFSIFNTFSVILAQRSRESALFRALGATRTQVLTSNVIEALLVGVTAAIVGSVIGLGLAALLSGAMASMGTDISTALQINPATLIVALIVGVGLTVIGSALPAFRASRVAPIAALSDAAIDESAVSRSRQISGVLLAVVGLGVLIAGALGQGDNAPAFVGLGSVLTVIGVVVLGPVVARPAAWLIGLPIALIRGSSGQLARENAMRNPRRTAGTASALMIGVTIVVLFTTFASSISLMVQTTMVGTVKADLLIVDDEFSGAGISTDLAQLLAERPEFDAAIGFGNGVALIEGEEKYFSVTDPAAFATILDNNVIAGDSATLGVNDVALVDDYAEALGVELGSTFNIEFASGSATTVTVGSIYTDAALSGDMIMQRDLWNQHSVTDTDIAIGLILADGVSVEQGRDAVKKIGPAYGAPPAVTAQEYADDMAGQIQDMLTFVYVLLALSIVIALMGIANTLALSVHERTRELGVLRAIGQTRSQLRTMVRWESVIIAIFGTVGGIGLGTILGWGLVTSLGTVMDRLDAVSVPIAQLVVIGIVGAATGVLAGTRPAARAAKLNILSAISTTG